MRVELYDVRRTKFVQAHTSALACIALSQDGCALATASQRGTLVRIHSTADGSKLQVPAISLLAQPRLSPFPSRVLGGGAAAARTAGLCRHVRRG